jgi:1-acyl-sn-glycerol-3-phosphate acyltransferase
MVKFIVLNSFIALHTILFCIWAFLLAALGKSGKPVHQLVAVPWAKIILRVCAIKVRVIGRQNVDPGVPRIYMSNHQSYFDIFALLAYLPVHFKFILKQELMGIPLFGLAMKKAGYIGLEREDPRKAIKSLIEAAEKIRKGASVVIFVEGTRSPDGNLLPFKKGGFNLALRSGCDIVPVVIKGSRRIVPKGSLKINSGTFDLQIGQPIPTKGLSKRDIPDLMGRVRAAILSQLTVDDSHQR